MRDVSDDFKDRRMWPVQLETLQPFEEEAVVEWKPSAQVSGVTHAMPVMRTWNAGASDDAGEYRVLRERDEPRNVIRGQMLI